MQQYRILIHVLSVRRDFASMYVLGKILEHYGCSVCLCSNRNYLSKISRLWRPHAVFFGTQGRWKEIIDKYPFAKYFFCATEGAENHAYFSEEEFLSRRDGLEKLSKVYLWGSYTQKSIKNYCKKNKIVLSEALEKKFILNGAPRLDIVRFNPLKPDNDNSISVGVVGSFSDVNLFTGETVLERLFRHKDIAQTTAGIEGIIPLSERAENICTTIRKLSVYIQIIYELACDARFKISLRPYPFENLAPYKNISLVRKGKLTIDDSLDFGSWISQQHCVIGGVSTTHYECSSLGIPIINADHLAGIDIRNTAQQDLDEQIHKFSFKPSSIDQIKGLILSLYQSHTISEEQKEFNHYIVHDGQKGSVLKRIAKDIISDLNKDSHSLSPLVPKKVIDIYDNILFYNYLRKDRHHANFNFSPKHHTKQQHYDKIVDAILADNSDC